ncbi:Uncharacterised protein [Amycolatopsis camponoti]|uniref:DUF3027 domain-containing protein n=1 Tax=Amycolatopsis camponoti TaxID=2606593 RepID=A0A6I8LD22_9PSEU|nr:Uncharacterised protein [Amycolatopsis camponoti]
MTLLLTLDDGSVQRKLADAVEFARAAVLDETPEEQIGTHVGVSREDAVTASHLFEAQVPGYRGWRWCVTVALAGDDEPVTVSEVVLVPGPEARIAPAWVPWERRVRAGDLGVGDIFPTDENDPRLVPAYLQSDDPAVEEVAHDAGLGRVHVLSRFGRTEAASRWHGGEFGPRSDMARSAPDVCGTCGFFVPLAGSLRGAFGVCTNDISPADGHVVDVEYGCGAHSEVEVEVTSSIPVAELVYDDSLLDFTPDPGEVVETPAAEPETAIAEADVSPAEVEPEVAADAAGGVAEPAEVAGVVAEPVAAEAEAAEQSAVAAGAESAQVDAAGVVAESAGSEVAGVVAEPAAVEPDVVGGVAEPVAGEQSAAEVDSAAAESAGGVAEAGADVVAEPVAAEPGAVAEPVVAEAEAAESDSAQVEAAGVAAEPVGAEQPAAPESVEAAGVVAEPQASEVTPAQADAAAGPAQAEATDLTAGADSGRTEVTDAGAAPVEASVPEPAEAEPTQAEVTDAVLAVGNVAQVNELPEAALTDSVVTEAEEPTGAHEPETARSDAHEAREHARADEPETESAQPVAESAQGDAAPAQTETAQPAEADETAADSIQADEAQSETTEPTQADEAQADAAAAETAHLDAARDSSGEQRNL